MKQLYKISTAVGAASLSLAFAVSVASADTSVVNSGAGANVDNSTRHNTSVMISNSNSSSVSQSSTSVSNSGGNATVGNIGGGSIATGAAKATSEQKVMANQNQTSVTLPKVAATGSSEVVNTGLGLDLNNSKTVRTTVDVNNTNSASISQQSMEVANSGLNFGVGNIGGGNIATGAASTNNKMGAEANINQTQLNLASVLGVKQGDLDLTNTGAFSDVDNSLRVRTRINVANSNALMANQSAFGLSNSGLNFGIGNIGGGNMATGSAASNADFDLMANKNNTGIALGADASAADVEAVNTGLALDLNNSTNVRTSVTAISSNNAEVAQTSVDVSNSGLNAGVGNVNGGSTATGSAGVWSGFMAGGNWNQTMF